MTTKLEGVLVVGPLVEELFLRISLFAGLVSSILFYFNNMPVLFFTRLEVMLFLVCQGSSMNIIFEMTLCMIYSTLKIKTTSQRHIQ